MRIGKLVAGALLVLACSGCVTDAELRAADEARCRSFGFRTSSEGFANCLLQLDLNRAADRRSRFDRYDAPPGWYYGRRWW
ncbi:hypothetical protein FQV39_03755 [Bosea sp. F3-2]|jgi:hypothetical protein|uniref:hypothetical protein n=1 Tax=Bosea sp. F3-2 TaxID=2599640 RepID=UPI0011EC0FCF|nr:hypothetical protein [Bosea sp. F3-2]QEL21785.1 hypothetical protein FQV39_03755 [Bosea sp. F3-2]